MSAFRAVIFDVDGLLIDTEPIWRQVEIEVFGSLGLRLSEAQCLETMGVRVSEVVELWYSRSPWSGPTCSEVTRRIEQGVIDHIKSEGEAMSGVPAAFRVVREAGLPIGVASSSSEQFIDVVLARLGLDAYVQVVCSADREVAGKPDPAVYLTAARQLGVPPPTCLALEDSPNGVVSATSAGMYCVAVPDPYLAGDSRMRLANVTLTSLEDFTSDLLLDRPSSRE
jgi:mannitol-1-/sugar-/sorbitol-6-/2-deoxyglucose-6-phosphatase